MKLGFYDDFVPGVITGQRVIDIDTFAPGYTS